MVVKIESPFLSPERLTFQKRILRQTTVEFLTSPYAVSCAATMKNNGDILWTKLQRGNGERFCFRPILNKTTLIPCVMVSKILDEDHASIRVQTSTIDELCDFMWQTYGIEWGSYLLQVSSALFASVEVHFEEKQAKKRK